MAVKQVYLFCNYTSNSIRSHLQLSSLKLDNAVRRLAGLPKLKYKEAAPWIEAFIRFFQTKKEEYSLHVVALHVGMKKTVEHFEDDNVHYHYIKSGLGIVAKLTDKLLNFQKKNDFPVYQRRYAKVLEGKHLDILVLCGAENPDYATAFINNDCPCKLVILQTLMNDPKRIAMGVSTDYRRKIEDNVIRHANNFAVPDPQWSGYIKSINPNAICHSFTFPTIEPKVDKVLNKQFDFVFFAGMLGRNKGTNDVVSALSIVVKSFPKITLNIIGGADNQYMTELKQQIKDLGIDKNIIMTPSFPVREDVFKQVAKSRCAVLPGITASLNSTVREVMLMGMPTITYETLDTILINTEMQCILTAKMENVNDLVEKMKYAHIHADDMKQIAHNGWEYAKKHFSQEAFNYNFDTILSKIVE